MPLSAQWVMKPERYHARTPPRAAPTAVIQRRPDWGYRASPLAPGQLPQHPSLELLQVPLLQSGLGKKLARAPGQTLRNESARPAARYGNGALREQGSSGPADR